MTAWSWAAARRRGTSHVRSGAPCQDAHRALATRNGGFVAVVSDGAGSAAKGAAGAFATTRTMAAFLQEHLASDGALPDDETLWAWMDAVRDRIGMAAATRSLTPRDFAATMVLAACHDGRTLLALVGDGVAAVREGGTWRVPSWPENGEYASTTFFVTDEPQARMRVLRIDGEPEALMLMSDGLERLALDLSAERPHAAFFETLVGPVERGGAPGRDARLCASLARYLDRPEVNERTDDDKTLVIAVRR